MRETIGPRKAERNSDSCFWLYEFVLGKASCFQQEDVLSLEVHISTRNDPILEIYEL